MSSIVNMDWVNEHLANDDLVLADCRFNLSDGDEGRRQYAAEHIPGSLYFDLDQDLSAPASHHGGRHPLPDVSQLAEILGRYGIGRHTTVVAYDEQDGMVASRFWWLLSYLGHERVYVMDGNFSMWKARGLPVTDVIPEYGPVSFEPVVQANWVVDVDDVRASLGSSERIVVDARAPERFNGESEPMDGKAGHIPGAQNRFWKQNLEGGRWKSRDELERRFSNLHDEEVIVYCGSGVSACPNILAMQEAGIQNVKLYPGSWSDWISYDNNPIETGES
ncbi:sulfurtransferase [Tuberibacillus sp. Marseille-P3662]|uniref:sulfurtransferase n=1 Tax=Tuberibacillus sp. Marseille-P3662 TaxID=1965358 RepID=UPI000A1C96C6|nr:sulfurtransferase [Tuberibacillus sp. Marseille-P3662]